MDGATATGTSGQRAPDPAAVRRLARELGVEVWWPDPTGAGRWGQIMRAARESRCGRLPLRYATDTWHVPMRPRLAQALRPGVRILDAGAGARPVVPAAERPRGSTYVGLDVDADEMKKAPPDSYDEIVPGDVCTLHPELVGRFDLVLSWLAMEHVASVPQALSNLRRYQRPGGRFLAYVSGAFSMHALLNRFLPHVLAKAAMRRALEREPDTVFRAYYHRCWYSALVQEASALWSRCEVVPVFTGGWYLRFSPTLRAPFLAFEEWAYSGDHRNLAAYYIVDAVV